MSIALKNVTKKYDDRIVLNDFSISFEEGKINCILGPSGIGKTTILRVLAGLTDYSGFVERPEKVSYIFQDSRLLPNLTVWENVEYVILDIPKEQRPPLIKNLLELTELYDRRNDFPQSLSGGMARRVAIARAYAYSADLLLMDEPFSALDTGLKLRQIAVYKTLASKYPRTSIFVSHDIDEALLFADKVFVMADGKIAETINLTPTGDYRDLFSPETLNAKKRLFEALTKKY